MDLDARRVELENQIGALSQYLQHPVTVEVLRDLKEGQEGLVSVLCDVPILDIESFFKHFESVGHLRGLRRAESLIRENLEDVKEQLKELPYE